MERPGIRVTEVLAEGFLLWGIAGPTVLPDPVEGEEAVVPLAVIQRGTAKHANPIFLAMKVVEWVAPLCYMDKEQVGRAELLNLVRMHLEVSVL